VPHYRIEFTNPAGEVVVYGAVNGRNHKKLDLPQSTLANLERERPTTNRIELEREFDVAGRGGYFAPPCYESDKAAGPTARLNF
jgi:hypothetical protein